MAQLIRMYETGAPQVLRVEREDPGMPGRGEVRISQDAIGVNFVDTMVRNGSYPVPLPTVPGFEGAGTVTHVGADVSGFAVGDRVAYFFAAGGYASERLVPAESLIRLPDDICTFTAATFLAKGFTAWMALRALYRLAPGETALVTGASGSVGSILSRWAKSLGATVISVAGSQDKLAKARAGSHHALYAGDASLNKKISALAPQGVDVVFDLVGQATADVAARSVRSGGTIVAIGGASGSPLAASAELAERGVHIKRGGTPQFVNGVTIGEASSELFALIRSGVFRDIDVVHFELTDAPLVHQSIEQRAIGGIPLLVTNRRQLAAISR